MNAKVTMVIRILLGVFMLTFGLNKFLHFIPFETPQGDMGTLMGVLGGSPFFTVIGVIEVVGGALLILGKYVPLAITFLTAVLFNATLFHLFFEPANVMGALVGLVLCLVLVYAYKDRFKELFSA
ncbi:MAG: DoxX family protein [Bacteroidia bacterium]|nr:DoxX family protein [Bacteroidia bacterium]